MDTIAAGFVYGAHVRQRAVVLHMHLRCGFGIHSMTHHSRPPKSFVRLRIINSIDAGKTTRVLLFFYLHFVYGPFVNYICRAFESELK